MEATSDIASDGSQDFSDYDESTTPTPDYDDWMCDRSSVLALRRYYEPPLYAAILALGSLGNLAVVWIYLHFRQRLKTMTDVYLLNLAVADLLFLGTLPLWASEATQGWALGAALCKLTWAFYKVNFYSSMWLLTCISVDRYVAIVRTAAAQNSKRRRLDCSKLVCGVVWLLATALAVPELVFAAPKPRPDGVLYCAMVYESDSANRTKILVLALQVCMGFCLPLVVMAFCYATVVRTLLRTRNFQKHKALRVILAVAAAFILSQLPFNAMLVVEASQAANRNITPDCEALKRFDAAKEVLKGVAYTHVCLNPFLYAFVGERFRRDVVRLLKAYGCWPTNQGKLSKGLRESTRSTTAMSDTDASQALSL